MNAGAVHLSTVPTSTTSVCGFVPGMLFIVLQYDTECLFGLHSDQSQPVTVPTTQMLERLYEIGTTHTLQIAALCNACVKWRRDLISVQESYVSLSRCPLSETTL